MVNLSSQQRATRYLQHHFRMSERRVCQVIKTSCAMLRYQCTRPREEGLSHRIKEFARTRVRYVHRRIHELFMHDGVHVNHKRVYQLYCEGGLQSRAKRRVIAQHRSQPVKARYPNQHSSVYFVSNQLINEQRFTPFTIVDVFTR